jgi:hypothetical protein
VRVAGCLLHTLVACCLALAVPGIAGAGTTYFQAVNSSWLGWLDQYSLDTAAYNYIGPEACVPTTATNALAYLQKSAPGVFGTALTGSSYSAWKAVAATLASPGYMNTSPNDGTLLCTIPYALTQYVVADRGFGSVQFSGMFQTGFWTTQYPKPSYIADGVPTWNFLYNAFAANTPAMLSVIYANGNGHEVLGSGLKWFDANGNGVIEFNENALMSFVDPLDSPAKYPDGQPGGGVKVTSGHLWYDADLGGLSLSYSQYQGDLPYDSSDYTTYTVRINSAFVIAVPEPAVELLLLTAGFALWLRRRGNGSLMS